MPLKDKQISTEWFFYLIRTRQGALYAGISTDVSRRLDEHENTPKGAKYLRSKGPLTLVYQVKVGTRALALRVEYAVKRLVKKKKERIVSQNQSIEVLLSTLGLKKFTLV